MNKALVFALFAAACVMGGCASDKAKTPDDEPGARSQDSKNLLDQSKPMRMSTKDKNNPAPCPNIVALSDAARVIQFDGDEELENIAYTGEILGVHLECRYYDDRPIEASVKIDMAFGRGPKGTEAKHVFPYFVAVTRKDLEVIEKAEFNVPVDFGKDHAVRTTEEKIGKIVIPRHDPNTSGTNFEVVVGFSVTPKEVIFNRSGKSLKFPNLTPEAQ